MASLPSLIGTAQMAEGLGFDSVWACDRLLYPVNPRTPYPGAANGALPEGFRVVYEPMTTLTFLAARTERLRVGTAVAVSAFRSPVLFARMLATLDNLSGGRAICGLGMGWSQDEYEASGVGFDDKGARFDEYLQVVRRVWTDDPAQFDGRYYKLPQSHVLPQPVQKPHIPLWVGGDSNAAIRRAAAHGTGWYPSGYVALDELPAKLELLDRELVKHGKSRPQFQVGLWIPFAFTAQPGPGLIGPPDHVKRSLDRLRALGIDLLTLVVGMVPGSDAQADLERLAREMMAAQS